MILSLSDSSSLSIDKDSWLFFIVSAKSNNFCSFSEILGGGGVSDWKSGFFGLEGDFEARDIVFFRCFLLKWLMELEEVF
jgi:hypothetical protein